MTDRLEVYATRVHELLDDSTVVAVLGKVDSKRNEQRRRIVWNRSQQASRAQRANRKSGGQKFTVAGGTPEETVVREIQGIDRFETAEVKIYAEDAEAVDLLFDAFLTAIDKLTGATDWSQDGIQYAWNVDEANIQRQPFIVALVRYRSPVAIETKTCVTIQTVVNSEQILTS